MKGIRLSENPLFAKYTLLSYILRVEKLTRVSQISIYKASIILWI